MATILKAKRNGGSEDSSKEKNTTSNNTTSAHGSPENGKELTYEEKLKEILERRKQNNKKFFSWKDREKATLLFTDPDHGTFDRVESTLGKKKIVQIQNPDGTVMEKEEWPMRDICDHKVREATEHDGKEVLGPEMIWRMPITAVEAFERFRKRRKFKLDIEKVGEGGQTRYMFFEAERDSYPPETEE